MQKPQVSGVDAQLALKTAAKSLDLATRRAFMRNALGLGSLTLLTGCDVTSSSGVEDALRAMSRWNDRVQAWLFDPHRLAPEFPKSAITDPFPFNAFYPEEQ